MSNKMQDGQLERRQISALTNQASMMFWLDLVGVKYEIGGVWPVVTEVDGALAEHVDFYPVGATAKHRGLDTRRPTLKWHSPETGKTHYRHYTVFMRGGRPHAVADDAIHDFT